MAGRQPPIDRLRKIMAKLRDPDGGCPWDREQTFATIASHTIEEAYEVVDAIETGDMDHLRDELGDLLLQVVFHAQMAKEAGLFDFDSIATAICDKMVKRHPHVFGDEIIETVDAQTNAWEEQKAGERAVKGGDSDYVSVLADVTPALPAPTRAMKLQKRAARVGFDWPAAEDAAHKIHEELAEVKAELAMPDTDDHDRKLEEELGDLLFAVVNLARKLSVDPERALRRANAKFVRRFNRIEDILRADGRNPEQSTLEEMDRLWNQAKAEERNPPPLSPRLTTKAG